MEKNYYEILEINKTASKEIMDKAYKTLIKKYHPDLQEDYLKTEYEEKLKLINEAYDILSNPQKKENYDLLLKKNEISIEEFNNLKNENINLKKEINYLKRNYINENKNYTNSNNYYKKQNSTINNTYQKTYPSNEKKFYQNNYQNAYHNTYTQNIKNKPNNKENQKTFIDYLALPLTILLMLFIFLVLLCIPFTRKYLINLYNENIILQFIVELFKQT